MAVAALIPAPPIAGVIDLAGVFVMAAALPPSPPTAAAGVPAISAGAALVPALVIDGVAVAVPL
jgi:hypothetical protein